MKTPTAKPVAVPRFVEGLDFLRGGKKGRWKWLLFHDIEVRFPQPLAPHGTGYVLMAGGHSWGCIRRDRITVKGGYAWDGSTCSPDLKGVMLASLVHDILFQFSGCHAWPKHLTREWSDEVFYHLATNRLRVIYYAALCMFSGCSWGRKPPEDTFVQSFSLIEPT